MDTMFKKVLLATDGSEDAALAARAAVGLCGRTGSELHVVHVWSDVPPAPYPGLTYDNYSRLHREEAAELLKEEHGRIREAGGRVAGVYLEEGRPADAIARLAEELSADLVVTGSRGVGTIKRLIAGSVSEGVARLAPCPVLVVRGAWPPRRLIVGDDSSNEAARAGELAASLGRLLDARALLVRAYPPHMFHTRAAIFHPPRIDELLEKSEEGLKGRAQRLERILGRRPEVSVVAGDPASVMQEAAEENGEPTLVAVGSRGYGAVKRFALGSVSTDVLRAVDRSALIVPPPRDGSR